MIREFTMTIKYHHEASEYGDGSRFSADLMRDVQKRFEDGNVKGLHHYDLDSIVCEVLATETKVVTYTIDSRGCRQ